MNRYIYVIFKVQLDFALEAWFSISHGTKFSRHKKSFAGQIRVHICLFVYTRCVWGEHNMKMQKRRQNLQSNHNHFFKHFATKTYPLLGGVYDPPGKS